MQIHCIGIAGSGMLPLAVYLSRCGHTVTGSDRFMDQQVASPKFDLLKQAGIELFPQDGSGITEKTDEIIYSGAVEATVPDRVIAKERGINELNRAEALARELNNAQGIAVAGSSGKSTTSAMVGYICEEAGLHPSLISGAPLLNYKERQEQGMFLAGSSDVFCIEADESDGSLIAYKPHIGLILNISRDHKELDELHRLFSRFAANAEKVIYNQDCPNIMSGTIPSMQTCLSFGSRQTADFRVQDISADSRGTTWELNGIRFAMAIPGAHNIENASAAAAAASLLNIRLEDSAAILKQFSGVERRMDIIGRTESGITVIDDFAHNPAKIKAALDTARSFGGNLIILYQPHGYGPTCFIRDELVEVCASILSENDLILITPIFYAGGTADKSISSQDLVQDLIDRNLRAQCIDREEAPAAIAKETAPGSTVLILGARDITLGTLARDIFTEINQ